MVEILRAGLPGALLMAALCGVFPRVAQAHGIRLHAHVEGDEICGRAEFVGGGAVAGAKITVYAPSGSRLGSTNTDDDGRFTFAPRETVDHRFWIQDGTGHGAEYIVKTAELPASILADAADGSGGASENLGKAIEDAVSRQVGPLHDKIDALQSSIRLHDILGGIGYIVGLTGLWFYFRARRPRGEQPGSDSEKQ
jgi:nickel transport protein